MKHIILVNPVAGRKKGKKYGLRIQQLLSKNNILSTIYISEYETHLTKIAKELALQEKCRFYSIGGDGTLNEIIQGIMNTDSEIVVTACGTGNDFIKSISSYFSMRKIIKSSLNSNSKKIDVIKLNNNRYCINVLNAGFDALIAQNLSKFRWVPLVNGKTKYNLAIIYTLFSNKNFKMKIRLNKKIYKQNFTLIAICNGKYYGGGVKPSPNAEVNDGKLDVCMIDSTSFFTKLKLLPKYKTGNHLNLKQVNLVQTDKLTIVSNKKFPISIDGEILYTNKLKCEIIPKCINLVNI